LSLSAIQSSAPLKTALIMFLAPGAVSQLLDPGRQEVVIAGGLAFLPPENGQINAFETKEWERQVQRQLGILKTETPRFISNAKASASYSNMMQGRVLQWFGIERGNGGKTAPEIAMEGAYKTMLRALNDLKVRLGVSNEQRKKITETLQTLNNIEKAYLDRGMNELNWAMAAAIAAPFVPLVMFAGPAFGAWALGGGKALAVTLAGATNMLALMPLALSMVNAVVVGSIKSSQVGGDVPCRVYEQFAARTSRSLTVAPVMAALPALVAGLSAGAGYVAPAVSSGTAVYSSTVAATTYGTLNLGVALGSVGLMTTNGIGGLKECYGALQSANQAAEAGNEDLLNSYAATAYTRCYEGGVDLAFALVQAGRITQSVYKALNEKGAAPQEGQSQGACLTGECSVPGVGNVREITPDEARAIYYKPEFAPTQNQAKAVAAYANEGYREINGYLKNGGSGNPAVDALVTEIDAAIAKTPAVPDNLQVYRGEVLGAGESAPSVGTEINNPAYTSTSVSAKSVKSFYTNRFLGLMQKGELKIKDTTVVESKVVFPAGSGAKGFYVPNANGVRYTTEFELLVARGAKFRVVESTASTEPVGGLPVTFVRQTLLFTGFGP
jgi:hypothetical protein